MSLPFRCEPMPLIGVGVQDFDAEVDRYESIFGLRFRVFNAGLDYELSYESTGVEDTAAPLPTHVRIAVDNQDQFELVDLPGTAEGFRNIHYRVDDLETAVHHFQSQGLALLHVVRAGNVREAIFDGTSLNNIRLCLVQFEGESFAQALADSTKVS